MHELGYAKEHGHVILSAALIFYGLLHDFLAREYNDNSKV